MDGGRCKRHVHRAIRRTAFRIRHQRLACPLRATQISLVLMRHPEPRPLFRGAVEESCVLRPGCARGDCTRLDAMRKIPPVTFVDYGAWSRKSSTMRRARVRGSPISAEAILERKFPKSPTACLPKKRNYEIKSSENLLCIWVTIRGKDARFRAFVRVLCRVVGVLTPRVAS